MEHEYMLTGLDNAHGNKGHITNSMVQPCGLGCQFLGPNRYACEGNSLCHNHFALGGITSCPAPLPCSPEEDDSQIPFCNKQ